MFHVYILTDILRSTLYVGSTDDLSDTIIGNKKRWAAFSARNPDLVHMIYLESFADGERALARHRQLKNWRNQWKWDLIVAANPKLRELRCVTACAKGRATSPKKTFRNNSFVQVTK